MVWAAFVQLLSCLDSAEPKLNTPRVWRAHSLAGHSSSTPSRSAHLQPIPQHIRSSAHETLGSFNTALEANTLVSPPPESIEGAHLFAFEWL